MTVPDTMEAIEISASGGPDVLRLVQRPVPAPGPGDVLIAVEAAGVNRPDILQRQGHYPPPPGASDIPGLEVAGRVAAVGGGTSWREGDAVCALVAGGGYARYCVAPGVQCLPIPRGLGPVEAAALPEAVFTVWTNVFERGALRAGESLLVHGGASGIGTTAIQMARARGAGRVLATAGTPEKVAACERLGALRGIDYGKEDFVEVVRTVTGGRGVDVILDMVGGDYVPRNLASLAEDGRLVQIAFLRGRRAEVDLGLVMPRRLTLTGSTLRARSVEEKGRIARAVQADVWPLIEKGAIRPVVHATFPLARAADAHRLMESGAHIGKIVLAA